MNQELIREIKARACIFDFLEGETRPEGNKVISACPFHTEKTHSFMIDTNGQAFTCLSCGASGGPIEFIMRKENKTFDDAALSLAKRYDLKVG